MVNYHLYTFSNYTTSTAINRHLPNAVRSEYAGAFIVVVYVPLYMNEYMQELELDGNRACTLWKKRT